MRETTLKNILVISGIIFTVIFCLTPFIYMLFTSFSLKPNFLQINIPFLFTLNNYSSLLTTHSLHFLEYLRNSLIVSSVSAIFCVLIAALAAYAIVHLDLPGKIIILMSVLVVSLFPQISLVSYIFKMMTNLGWINTYPGLIVPYIAWTLPLSLWILVSYFSQIPKELVKAAHVDGCTPWQTLTKVIFPVAAPGILSTILLAFIFAFNEFMFALMLTTDHTVRTIPVGLALFEGLHGQIPWGTIMAASSLTILPIIILTIIFQRHIIAGLTRGAVKE